MQRTIASILLAAGMAALPVSAMAATKTSATQSGQNIGGGFQGDYLFNLVAKPGYREAWAALTARTDLPSWVSTATGPSSPSRLVFQDKRQYELASSCKQHDCANNRLLVLFDKARKQAWGVWISIPDNVGASDPMSRHANARYIWLGEPSGAIKSLLLAELQSDPNW